MSDKPLPISPVLGRTLDAIRLADLPAMLVGPHGIGKSQFLEGYAISRGLSVHVLDLSLLEATDLTGIPYIEGRRTRFAAPSTLPDPDTIAPTMLVLEELNRCDRSVRQPCLQLLTTRRLNDYRLPSDCFLTACINPEDAGYEVDALDPALASRFVSLLVRPDHDAWLEWARHSGVHPGVVRFVSKFPQAFDRAPPRTWTQAASLMTAALGQGWSVPELEVLLNPVLGQMTARALLLDLPDVMPTIPPDQLLSAASEYVGAFQTWMSQGRLDIVGVLLEGLRQRLLDGPPPARIDSAGLIRILDTTPPDLALPILDLVESL
ncbi:MAG: hypothetical protein ACI8RZ_000450 [Myxococcota bacterium]|jgi:hypothetical protein